MNDMDMFGEINIKDEVALELLSRISDCEVALKGAYELGSMLDNDFRMTKDIDLSIHNIDKYSIVRKALVEIGELLINKGLCNSYTVKDEILPGVKSGGATYKLDNKVIISVDVGCHDLMYGVTEYSFGVIPHNGFSVERMLSDKLHSIFSIRKLRRAKDIYDIYIILNKFNVNREELDMCLNGRKPPIDWKCSPYSKTYFTDYTKAYTQLQLKSSTTGKLMNKPEITLVFKLVERFTNPLSKNEKTIYWDSSIGDWV